MGPTRPYKRKPRGLPGALHLNCFCVVAFSAENRKSTFPENASFAWSHFLRKTGSPLFRKMLRSEVAALEVAAQIEAHVRIGIGTEIVVVVVNRGALRRRTRLS